MHVTISKTLLLALAASASIQAHAAVQNLQVGTPLPRFSLIKEGTHHYLRYRKTGEVNTPVDIWTRTVSFETVNGEKLMRVKQHWDGVTPAPYTLQLDSWFEIGTFKPRTHQRITDRDGKHVVEGFVFASSKVTGMQDLVDNKHKDLSLALPEPTYNFETDVEFLQALPLAEGYEVSINFYHPGGRPPARYTWKVTGSETIAGPAGPVDCWVVTTDYNTPGAVSKFYFAKNTQLMVRQESVYPQMPGVFVKTMID